MGPTHDPSFDIKVFLQLNSTNIHEQQSQNLLQTHTQSQQITIPQQHNIHHNIRQQLHSLSNATAGVQPPGDVPIDVNVNTPKNSENTSGNAMATIEQAQTSAAPNTTPPSGDANRATTTHTNPPSDNVMQRGLVGLVIAGHSPKL